MNIFVLDKDPAKAAMMMCDKHIPKMIVESAQMLSTAHRMLDGKVEKRPSKSGKTMVKHWILDDQYMENILYKAVHMHHPCTTWTMESAQNYRWHFYHFQALGREFGFRRNKKHATIELLTDALANLPININEGPLTEFAQAMSHYPDCKVEGDPVKAYRNYNHAAKPFAEWKWGREAPTWWKGYTGASLHS